MSAQDLREEIVEALSWYEPDGNGRLGYDAANQHLAEYVQCILDATVTGVLNAVRERFTDSGERDELLDEVAALFGINS